MNPVKDGNSQIKEDMKKLAAMKEFLGNFDVQKNKSNKEKSSLSDAQNVLVKGGFL
jgi:hypothetical protein